MKSWWQQSNVAVATAVDAQASGATARCSTATRSMPTTFPCSGAASALAVAMQQVVTKMATGESKNLSDR